ncbi:hypothetical protein MMC19_000376 [Ptychographa xylographoides]|nr:hypothetical protein [Ptychographa xylographoides]
MSRVTLTTLTGAASALLTLVETAFLFIIGTGFAVHSDDISVITFIAAALQVMSLVMLVYLTGQSGRMLSTLTGGATSFRTRDEISTFVSLAMSLLAEGTSLATLVWMHVALPTLSFFLAQRPSTLLVMTLVPWVLSVVLQSFFYLLLLLHRYSSAEKGEPQPISLTEDLVETSQVSRPGTSRTLNATPPRSPTIYPKRSSLRSSLTIAIRPTSSKTNSKTNLVPRQSRDYPASMTTTRASTDSAFDSWDTSNISPQMRETVLRSSPALPRNPLPPIPGSRSPSPAKALDGPYFFPEPASSEPPSLSRPSTSRSQPSSPPPVANSSYFTQALFAASHSQPSSPTMEKPSVFTSFSNLSRPSILRGRSSTESLPHVKRARSASTNTQHLTNEDHIHPLFRSNSPTPPPSATPGTIVTAAPGSFAGLLINERMIHRMRSGSLPSSPSPLAHGTGYFFPEDAVVRTESNIGRVPSTDDEDEDDEDDDDDDRRREEMGGGEERKMTPPIPEFILSVGRSDSMVYGKRRPSGPEGVTEAG